MRIEYILKVFPDAQFVVIHRAPCAVINSFINGWRDTGLARTGQLNRSGNRLQAVGRIRSSCRKRT
ncbi:sulfotransferase [Marinobacter panjinensis]|uniref:Sulfotransferase n=1 Tax=Marinobacter panjinensis TaxID=2576384 RepID=A0A4V6CVB5_9GAMM|nr:sulfotransferase [Marinobacter panjinensis]